MNMGNEHTVSEYIEAVVSFIDILGFRNLLEEKSVGEIRDILGKFQNISAANNQGNSFVPDVKKEISEEFVFSISDAIVRVRLFESNYTIEALELEISRLAQIQRNLIMNGVIIRGGLTIGKVHI